MASPMLITPHHAPLPSESVYDISDKVSAVPSHYSTGDSIPQAINIKSEGADSEEVDPIPVIDFYKLTSGTPEEQAQALKDLRYACEEWGFFQLVNHGISETLRVDLLNAFKKFFDLPMEEKQKYPDRFAESQILDPIRYGSSFNLKADDIKYWRDFLKLVVFPDFHCPPNPSELSGLLREFVDLALVMGRKTLTKVWETLGVDDKRMTESLNLDSTFQILICNLYPRCPQPDKAMGLPPHSDHGLLSILYQNEIDGLEILKDNKWYRVKARPNAFLINTGDHMEIASNGKYKSLIHRVIANQQQTRMSIATNTSPAGDAVVLPAPELVTDETPARFRGITYNEFVRAQQNNALKDRSILDSIRIY